jgi:Cyanobacterial and plant NDH-1 subunit O
MRSGIDEEVLKEPVMAVKKGDLVRAVREKLENSLEAKASDTRFPPYIFDSKGEVVDLRGDYALVKFGKVPTPNIWLRVDQLESFK